MSLVKDVLHPLSYAARNTTPLGNIVELTFSSLDGEAVVKSIIDSVKDNASGAIGVFIGTTRDNFQGKTVVRLEYQAYTLLAMKTLSSTADAACTASCLNIAESSVSEQNSVDPAYQHEHNQPSNRQIKCAIVHRLGDVPVGETSIVIAVSTPHRREAFEACEWLLEEVKKKAQIWKREWYAGTEGGRSDGAIVAKDGAAVKMAGDPPPQSLWKANFPPKPHCG
ncbi:uncharacterized protein EI90DRAFT_2926973 [Cantharellus anzutake]|uniref:uncharacterized protein n=1 Tax=Cantharellus anzutake TaxID=1750568 RepID=UPI0019053E46|nr:uncharacterized protein EI90DRAFT_2926973 [Cantharellus anzutake]KAF8327911.1 hypothetical protein EI90DRAFT_2926973 [Cantharellus anzutake]